VWRVRGPWFLVISGFKNGSLERGTYLDVCTPVFVFILFQGDPEDTHSESV
jgi:hypothetical protein